MNSVKYNKGGKLKISQKSMTVEPPKVSLDGGEVDTS